MLSSLSSVDQEAELRESRAALERVTGGPVTSLAYPFGTPAAFTDETIRLAQVTGYERAYGNTAGPNDPNRRHRLPRHMVYDWTGDEFLCNVRRWFASL
jgi:peptidoglycan/xylan/chitin deacetylase (PgdA/CDA1 family)